MASYLSVIRIVQTLPLFRPICGTYKAVGTTNEGDFLQGLYLHILSNGIDESGSLRFTHYLVIEHSTLAGGDLPNEMQQKCSKNKKSIGFGKPDL